MNITIINCFDTYEQRMNLLIELFSDLGWNVLTIESDYLHSEKAKRKNRADSAVYINTYIYKKNLSLRRIYSHCLFASQTLKYLKDSKREVDILWVLLPPNSLAACALNYKKISSHTKIVFDIIDLWPEALPFSKHKFYYIQKKWKEFRNKILIKADYVVSECNYYNNFIPKECLSRSSTLYMAKEIKLEAIQNNLPQDYFSLCYLGSINNLIDYNSIKQVVEELSELKPVLVNIIGAGESKQYLLKSLSKVCKIKDYGTIYDVSKKQQIFNSCHYGLNLMKADTCVGLTMKSVDYFAAGLPIISNIKGDTELFVRKYKLGINYTTGANLISDVVTYDYDRDNIRSFYKENLSKDYFCEKLNYILEEI